MMTTARRVLSLAVLIPMVPALAATAPPQRVLVICSPGSPGSTLQAQQTMDVFAETVAKEAGRPPDSLSAVYHQTAEAGLTALTGGDAALAMVPLPFLMRYGAELSLQPKLEAVKDPGLPEVWSLVAKKGSITAPASLSGWEITGAPGYAESFVRGVMLAGWGRIPADAKVVFGAQPLAALRRAASGEKVAVILDAAGAKALGGLPFAADVEVVALSKPMPSGFLCTIGKKMPVAETDRIVDALLHMHEKAATRDVLKMMTIARFAPVDQKALDQILKPATAAP